MTVIGITGPTGAGKTTALAALEELGAVVIDCDGVYHQLLEGCRPMLEELRGRYGDGIFRDDGGLDRKALGAVVFEDPAALADLNRITHRYVLEEVERGITQAEGEGRPATAVDAIALLESGLGARCHCTVAVTAPDEVRVRRIMERDGISEGYARSRVAAQKNEEFFRKYCDHVLYNDTDKETFREKASILFKTIIGGKHG